MQIFTPKTSITFGLVSIMVSTMISVMFMGIGPNLREIVMNGRASLCESIAVDTSINLSRNDVSRIRALMTNIVQRNGDIESAGVRRTGGQLIINVGDHDTHWEPGDKFSTETHVQVPLRVAGEAWGMVELKFRPINAPGFWGWLSRPWTKYVGISAAIAFLVFSFYLSFVLRQLDPSQAVPKRVRTALDSLAEGLLVTDDKGRVILANQAFAGWAGKSSDKLIGRFAAKFPWVIEKIESDVPFQFPWVAAIEQESAQAGVLLKLVDHEGKKLMIVANSSPVLGSDGQYRGVLTSFEDVTELEQSKVELIHAKTAADEANRSKSEFLAHMSHEIRTPMNAILGYTEVLRSGSSDPEPVRQKHLNTIQASGQHLLSLINDILDLSKIESGRLDLEIKQCSLQDIFSQVISVMKIKSEEKGILLEFEAEGKLPLNIETDEVRLRQTLINLVGNAIKFTDKGGVGIMARMVNVSSRPLLQIDVADTGIGMSREALTKIFNPFSQADNSITRRFGGTGLGLAICRQLVEKLGGEISVTSRIGQGSKFSFTIDPGDLQGITFAEFNLQAETETVSKKPEETVFKFSGSKILVVDDSETNRELVALFLRQSEVVVEMAENGQVGLEMALAGDFDVVLMDMQMPVMDGFTATRRLRDAGYQLPIIALTANVMKDDEQKCLDSGCSGFLPKPISKSRLLEMLSDVLPHTLEMSPALSISDCLTAEQQPVMVKTGVEPVLEKNREAGNDLSNYEAIYSELTELTADTSDSCFENECEPSPFSLATLGSSLPMDDEDYRLIVEMFVERLRSQLLKFRKALDAGDFKMLADLAHWLKGSGGTAGFEPFTEPSKLLQQSAELENSGECEQRLAEIEHLAAIIVIGSSAASAAQSAGPG